MGASGPLGSSREDILILGAQLVQHQHPAGQRQEGALSSLLSLSRPGTLFLGLGNSPGMPALHIPTGTGNPETHVAMALLCPCVFFDDHEGK